MTRINEEYRIATKEDLVRDATVFCYYVTPTPCGASLGTVLSEPDSEGWVDVQTDDGLFHYFNAERLGVLK